MADGLTVSNENILAALSRVQEPELHKDLVTLNMIQDIKINRGKVSFTIVLTTPACPLRNQIEQQSRQAVLSIPGVEEVDIKMEANVPSDGRSRGLVDLPIRNAVAIASGKGGVGKEHGCSKCCRRVGAERRRVGLMDADIYGPNVPTMMGLDQLPVPQAGKLIPAEAYGVKVMSIGFMVKPNQPLIWRGPMLHSAIRQFLTDVAWGELDYLIVDLPPGTGDAPLSLAQSLPLSGGVIVTLPQLVSQEDARRSLEMFRQLNVDVIGVVENMSYLELPDGTHMDIFGSGGGQQLAEQAGVPFIGAIPIDPAVRTGGDNGIPVVIADPELPVARALRSISEDIAARVSVSALSQTNFIPINLVG